MTAGAHRDGSGLPHSGVGAADAQVGEESELETGTGGNPVDSGDDRLVQGAHGAEQQAEVVDPRLGGRVVVGVDGRGLCEVLSGAEGASGAGEHDRATRFVAADFLQRRDEPGAHLAGPRVELVGTVEGDLGDVDVAGQGGHRVTGDDDGADLSHGDRPFGRHTEATGAHSGPERESDGLASGGRRPVSSHANRR
ncbi:hypothetical protein SANTM175S_06044 [Streptomyces antimycoticus]